MQVELVSFRYNLPSKKRFELMVNIINQSQADLIVFCGHTLKDKNDLCALDGLIVNKSSFILFEVKQIIESDFLNLRNCLYLIKDGIVYNLFTNQFFSTNNEIEGNESLCERFINELETRRRFVVKGMNCLVLQCGEINIVKNIQKEDNKPVFRHGQRKDLEERFNNLLNNVQIIINPIHTPMGNQGKMEKRRELLSANNRYYLSVSQNGTKSRKDNKYLISMNSRSLQYSFYNGFAFMEIDNESTNDYQKRLFEL